MRLVSNTRIALVTGASGGIGADVAQRLADANTHVIVNDDAAEGVVGAIRDAGGSASTIAADVSDATAVSALVDEIAEQHGRLDLLVLASGRTAFGVDPGDAMRRHRDAQRRLARLALPVMPAGGRIVFVTSHQAHFYPHKAVPVGYAAVAAGMRAGETALHAMRSEFASKGLHLTVVSGDLTSAGELTRAIVDAARTPRPSSIVYVDGPACLAEMSA